MIITNGADDDDYCDRYLLKRCIVVDCVTKCLVVCSIVE